MTEEKVVTHREYDMTTAELHILMTFYNTEDTAWILAQSTHEKSGVSRTLKSIRFVIADSNRMAAENAWDMCQSLCMSFGGIHKATAAKIQYLKDTYSKK